MALKHAIKLTFKSDAGTSIGFTIPRANPLATDVEVADSMAAIIDSGIVVIRGSQPIERKKAELVTTDSVNLEI